MVDCTISVDENQFLMAEGNILHKNDMVNILTLKTCYLYQSDWVTVVIE